jgi:hypothetical protein
MLFKYSRLLLPLLRNSDSITQAALFCHSRLSEHVSVQQLDIEARLRWWWQQQRD